MKLRKRTVVNYTRSTGNVSSDDSSGSVQVGKRTRQAMSRNNGGASTSKLASSESIVVSDSEDDEDVFQSPIKRIKAVRNTARRSTRTSMATYKEASSTEEEEDESSEEEVEAEEHRSRKQMGAEPERPRRSRIVKHSHAAETTAFTRPQRSCNLKTVVEKVVEVESDTESEDEPSAEQAVSNEYTVGRYGLQVNGEFPRVKPEKRIEKILAVRERSRGSPVYCVKLPDKSYRDALSVTEATLQKYAPMLLRSFLRRMDSLGRLDGNLGTAEEGPAFDPQYLVVDRIIAERRGRTRKFYIKWKGLTYSDATWEPEDRMVSEKAEVQRFIRNSSNATKSRNIIAGFKDGRTLRDYQKAGVAWLDRNYQLKVNCILADEMGLGKTIQSVAMLENLRSKYKRGGPFLVIAPVSTLGHWQREIESLTDMNCVVYGGSHDDRVIIQQYEFWDSKRESPKFTVLLSSFEILLKDQRIFGKISWEYVIIDEAHRLKSRESKTTCAFSCLDINKGGLLLLTGTPVQNNTREMFSLLALLDPEEFASEDDFMKKYGNIRDIEQVKELQESILKPRLLRRMKEDVEKSIPLKEETIIWIELTKEQRRYYRAIYENKIQDLMKGAHTSNIPNLRNMSMELRKICNHPFLCDGIEDDFNSKFSTDRSLVQSSGKMVLLDKMLPMLKDGGHRVLIFSQFTIMLDILEDYLASKDYAFERIDGKIRGSDRQAAIDRYSAKDSKSFVFLLSTRAGGLGITLTAADTCIIYDSDWNPQNDLQAMARCHRIGQTKDVKIYRLITKNTYEQHLFECSSRKYGLDEALLGNFQDVEPEELTKNIESLLRRGAYDMLREDGDGDAEAFDAENIDHILQQRTQKRTIGGRSNSTFSVATFVSIEDLNHGNENVDLEMNAEDFWKQVLPEACDRKLDESVKKPKGRRRRNNVDYRENVRRSEAESDSDSINEKSQSPDLKVWTKVELRRLEKALAVFGKVEAGRLAQEARIEDRTLEEVEEVAEAFIQLCQYLHAKEPEGTESSEHPALPPVAENAFKSKDVMQRLEKKASRYLRIFHERDVIAKAIKSTALSISLPRSPKLPAWWSQIEDIDLLKGVHIHGHKRYSEIRCDPTLCFASRSFEKNNDDPGDGENPSDRWPSDTLLSGRLQKILKALSRSETGQIESTKDRLQDEGKLRKRAKVSAQQVGAAPAEAIPVYVDNSSDSDGQKEAKSSSKVIQRLEPAGARSISKMNKENVVPRRYKRGNSDEKQATLLGFFSPKAPSVR